MAVGLKLGKGTIIAGVTIKTKKIKETKTERLLWNEWKAETVNNFDFSVSHHCKEINEH